jgi:exopolysaccharide biosynthesis polyprenyl glycosylphosphotransferase
VARRLLDLVLAAVALVVTAPLLAAAAIGIRLSSRGPVVYRAERVGKNRRPFIMYKLRTMHLRRRSDTSRITGADDPRVFPFGAWLRALKIDELPQLWNVLLGDMSLVGPRPERPVFIDQFRRHIPRYQLRHMVKSGMTGWAQIHGLRGNTSIQKRVEYDLYYIEHWSLLLDLKILARTLAFGFLSRNAY